MIKKSIIVTSAALVLSLAATMPANADVTLGIQVGPGVGFYTPGATIVGPGVGVGPRRFSCNQGRRIVRRNGFRRVRTIRCGSRSHVYRARANGDRFRVRVNAFTGEITRVSLF